MMDAERRAAQLQAALELERQQHTEALVAARASAVAEVEQLQERVAALEEEVMALNEELEDAEDALAGSGGEGRYESD